MQVRCPHCILRMRNLTVPPALGRRAGSYLRSRKNIATKRLSYGGPWPTKRTRWERGAPAPHRDAEMQAASRVVFPEPCTL